MPGLGPPKHLWSIYQKMKRTGRDLEQIYDASRFRVITESVRDCYEALGVVHSSWTPVPGRFKDFIALPKPNLYQSLHTTVIGPRAERIEIQIRTQEMHRIAEQGIAAHWKYKEGDARDGRADGKKFAWLRQLMEWQRDLNDPTEFIETVKIDLFDDEVFVFTPKGDVKALPKGSTPIDSRVRGAHVGRRPLLRRARQRHDRSAALPAAQRRHRRDPHAPEPEAEQGLAQVRRHQPGADEDSAPAPEEQRERAGSSAATSRARAAQARQSLPTAERRQLKQRPAAAPGTADDLFVRSATARSPRRSGRGDADRPRASKGDAPAAPPPRAC